MTQRKPLGRIEYDIPPELFRAELRNIGLTTIEDSRIPHQVVFDSISDFEEAAREIWEAGFNREYLPPKTFNDIWPELKKRLVGGVMSDADDRAEAEYRDYVAEQAEEAAYQRGRNDTLDAVLEMINKSEYAFDTVGGSKRLTALVQQLRTEKEGGE